MKKRSRLSKTRQKLAAEYYDLALVLAKYFVQSRPGWQKGLYMEDLESEGLLAITKAARTYDKKRLPYPKAYFARAALNGMLKWIKKETRTPAENRISLEAAADLRPVHDEMDHLRMAIESLPEEDQELAWHRFKEGATLRTLSESHQIPLRIASLRSRRISRSLSEALDIRLVPRDKDSVHLVRGTSPSSRPSKASANPASPKRKRYPGR
jgi:RNA polymerase sigma factor (sigma-70 family)